MGLSLAIANGLGLSLALSQLLAAFDLNTSARAAQHELELGDEKAAAAEEEELLEVEEDRILQILEDLTALMVFGANTPTANSSAAESEAEAEAEAVSSLSSPSTASVSLHAASRANRQSRERHRYRNRVVLDWNGEQFRHRKGYTSADFSDVAHVQATEQQSFFVPFVRIALA